MSNNRPIVLISYQEFQDSCAAKCHFSGYVYLTDGTLWSVESIRKMFVTSTPAYPNHKSLWYTKGTEFTRTEYVTKITVVDLEGYDFVFDSNGSFIETKAESDSTRKGQIYIRKFKGFTNKNDEFVEDARLQDMKDMLTPEAYSRMFTYIIGLLMRDELKLLRNQEISVQRLPATSYVKKRNIYNMTEEEWYGRSKRTPAFHQYTEGTYNDHIVVAIVRGHHASYTNLEYYSTIWNVLNMLGAHELFSHTVLDFLNDAYGTHYLAYGYQIKHPTWKYTTPGFKEDMWDCFHSYFERSRETETRKDNKGSEIYPWLKERGLYRSDDYGRKADSLFLHRSIFPRLEDREIKKWGEEFRKFPKLKDYKK